MSESKHCLAVECPGEPPKLFLLSADLIMIGRAPSNTIVLKVDTVSGGHCELRRRAQTFDLIDLGSTNGTRLNTGLIGKEAEALRDGDIIQIGLDVIARFHRLLEVTEVEAKGTKVDDDDTTKKLKSQKPSINPVAAAVARASEGG